MSTSVLDTGAPMGISRPIHPGGHFPLYPSEADRQTSELADLYTFVGNHPSFDRCWGEVEPPTFALIREHLSKGYGEAHASREEAERAQGRTFPAPLGNIRKEGRWRLQRQSHPGSAHKSSQ